MSLQNQRLHELHYITLHNKLIIQQKGQREHQGGVQAFRRTGAARKNSDPRPTLTNSKPLCTQAAARPPTKEAPAKRGNARLSDEEDGEDTTCTSSRQSQPPGRVDRSAQSWREVQARLLPPSSVPSSRAETTETEGRRKAWTQKYAFE